MNQTDKNQKRANKKELFGLVVRAKMDKTISVCVYRPSKDKKYGKYIKKKAIFKVHDRLNKAREGDRVRIFETRPISKTKKWMLGEINSTEKRTKK